MDMCLGKRRLNLVINRKISIELKTITKIDKARNNQFTHYLKIFKTEVGLLSNFGKQSLEFKRLINSNLSKGIP